jgi:hypothetical protein
MIMMGYFFIATVFTLTALLTLKLRLQTENHSCQQLTNVFGQQPESVWLMRDGIEDNRSGTTRADFTSH